jgi:hypothetical protein
MDHVVFPGRWNFSSLARLVIGLLRRAFFKLMQNTRSKQSLAKVGTLVGRRGLADCRGAKRREIKNAGATQRLKMQ